MPAPGSKEPLHGFTRVDRGMVIVRGYGGHKKTRVSSSGRRAAAIYTLIATAKLNDVDPQAWLADVLARLSDHPAKRVHELLPWNWRRQNVAAEAA